LRVAEADLLDHEQHEDRGHAVVTEALPQLDQEDRRERTGLGNCSGGGRHGKVRRDIDSSVAHRRALRLPHCGACSVWPLYAALGRIQRPKTTAASSVTMHASAIEPSTSDRKCTFSSMRANAMNTGTASSGIRYFGYR